MRQILAVAFFVALAKADQDQEPAAAANPHRIHHDEYSTEQHPDGEPLPGPPVLRSTHSHHFAKHNDNGPDVNRQNVIIRRTYDPDYYEPTIILDYRYMKTGGRDYTRGPGGQYLILPKGIHLKEQNEFENYDALLEHLRLKNLAETEYKRAHYH
ncbi:unnamed protein product [Parnassius apollo]|uniref:(apollo) hypothetical protein n=1 Tax=Parnassius apollo TaxID=110799 RepID=A0A8S3W5F8_PARAO|nr:unnamed protein product [Parnassius apollo]